MSSSKPFTDRFVITHDGYLRWRLRRWPDGVDCVGITSQRSDDAVSYDDGDEWALDVVETRMLIRELQRVVEDIEQDATHAP